MDPKTNEQQKRKTSVNSHQSKNSNNLRKSQNIVSNNGPLTQSVLLNSYGPSNLGNKIKNLTSVLNSRPSSGKKRTSAKRSQGGNEMNPPKPDIINISNQRITMKRKESGGSYNNLSKRPPSNHSKNS